MGLQILVRTMIRRDFDEVLNIEWLCFPHPWSEADLMESLQGSGVCGIVGQYSGSVVAYAVYLPIKGVVEIWNLAVVPSMQKRGIGKALIRHIARTTQPNQLSALISEANVDAQLFAKQIGFRCIETLRNYDDQGGDAYRFAMTPERTTTSGKRLDRGMG